MRSALVAAILVGCGGSKAPAPAPAPTVATATPKKVHHHTPDDDRPPGELVTDKVNEMNSTKYGRPPVTFNPGHPSAIKAPPVTHTATGYTVAFQASAV